MRNAAPLGRLRTRKVLRTEQRGGILGPILAGLGVRELIKWRKQRGGMILPRKRPLALGYSSGPYYGGGHRRRNKRK